MNTSPAIAEREDNTHYGSFLRAKIMSMALDLASAVTTYLRRAGSPLGPSTYCWGLAPFLLWRLSPFRGTMGQAPPQTSEPVPYAPHARLTTRLRDFATNCHE